MEKFEKSFMIINMRRLLLFNHNIVDGAEELYDYYKDKVNDEDSFDTINEDSEDSIDQLRKKDSCSPTKFNEEGDSNSPFNSLKKDITTPCVGNNSSFFFTGKLDKDEGNSKSKISPYPDKKLHPNEDEISNMDLDDIPAEKANDQQKIAQEIFHIGDK